MLVFVTPRVPNKAKYYKCYKLGYNQDTHCYFHSINQANHFLFSIDLKKGTHSLIVNTLSCLLLYLASRNTLVYGLDILFNTLHV